MYSGVASSTLGALILACGLVACSTPNPHYGESVVDDASAKDGPGAPADATGTPIEAQAPFDTSPPVDALAPDAPDAHLIPDSVVGDLSIDRPAEPADAVVWPIDERPVEPAMVDSAPEVTTRPDLLTGLIGYWRMDETPGSQMARDSSGLNHHGVLENLVVSSVWVGGGRFGSALSISDDDKNSGVRVEATTRIASIKKYTIAAWARRLRLRPTSYQSIISRQRGQGIAEVFDMSVSMDKLIAYAPDRTTAGVTAAAVAAAAPVGTWFHAAASFDGTTLRIYQDGVLRDETTWVGTLPASDRPLYLGTNKNESGLANNHHPWEGHLDEILLYDVVLSEEAILGLAQGERPPVP